MIKNGPSLLSPISIDAEQEEIDHPLVSVENLREAFPPERLTDATEERIFADPDFGLWSPQFSHHSADDGFEHILIFAKVFRNHQHPHAAASSPSTNATASSSHPDAWSRVRSCCSMTRRASG